jgi:predicted O-methyltransferase YrrM
MGIPILTSAPVIEEALAFHPAFGDSDYILAQLQSVFVKRVERVARDVGSAAHLLSALINADSQTRARVTGNTVIRCAVEHAFNHLETGIQFGLSLAECEIIFERVAMHLASGETGTPFENGAFTLGRLGDQSHHGWVWSEDYPEDAFGAAFRKIIDLEYGEGLCSITADELAMLRQGELLLRELLPQLSVSALRHVHLIGCFPDRGFWRGKVSSSQIRVGGTIFLNRSLFKNAWCTAEHLLHEALHQKLYDFRHGHSLLDLDAPHDQALRVVSLWNAQEFSRANHWDTHRAFAAFHVYVQLALLAKLAEHRASELEEQFGRFCGMVESRKAFDRAWYLGEALLEECSSHLGPAGVQMRAWLMKVLENLDIQPPPKGAYIHLMLDLFEREGNRVDAVMDSDERARLVFEPNLVPAAQEEFANAKAILSAIGAEPQLLRLEEDIKELVGDDITRNFPVQRRLIAQALRDASIDGFGLNAQSPTGVDADRMVRSMVECGSDNLYLMQTNVPRHVAGAKRRAKDLRFESSCQDEVGRLLSVLAAGVRDGGRILEIGTGAGVGLAWIVTGLRGRHDVEVISIEGDRRLAASVAELDWPSNVNLVIGDACELIAQMQRFDLVFADAAPAKYGDLEVLLGTLRPGGTLVVDDLCAAPGSGSAELEERDRLRMALMHHCDLQTVDLDWSTRVVIATKVVPTDTACCSGARPSADVVAAEATA